MTTFTKEISFINPAFFDKDAKPQPQHTEKEVTKTATFKELSRTDKDQHKLHFTLIGISLNTKTDDGKIKLDTDSLYEVTVKVVTTLLVTDDKFTEIDKELFLSDSSALIDFGFWFIGEKLTPFFSILMKK